jgi:hypothetical protein
MAKSSLIASRVGSFQPSRPARFKKHKRILFKAVTFLAEWISAVPGNSKFERLERTEIKDKRLDVMFCNKYFASRIKLASTERATLASIQWGFNSIHFKLRAIISSLLRQ